MCAHGGTAALDSVQQVDYTHGRKGTGADMYAVAFTSTHMHDNLYKYCTCEAKSFAHPADLLTIDMIDANKGHITS